MTTETSVRSNGSSCKRVVFDTGIVAVGIKTSKKNCFVTIPQFVESRLVKPLQHTIAVNDPMVTTNVWGMGRYPYPAFDSPSSSPVISFKHR